MHKALEQFSMELQKQDRTWEELPDEERPADPFVSGGWRAATELGPGVQMPGTPIWSGRADPETDQTASTQLVRILYPKALRWPLGGGRIDRLDILKENGKVYVKIIDYKTGNTTFDLTRVYYGLQLQLMIYSRWDAALQVEKKRNPEAEIIPAGLFYFHVKDPFLSGSLDTEESELEEERLKEYKMSGLAWADPGITRRMDASGKAIPVGYKKDGSFTQNSSVATSAQMRSAGRHTAHLVDEFCRRILEGDTRILPWRLGSKTPCEYCEYRDSLRIRPQDPGI